MKWWVDLYAVPTPNDISVQAIIVVILVGKAVIKIVKHAFHAAASAMPDINLKCLKKIVKLLKDMVKIVNKTFNLTINNSIWKQRKIPIQNWITITYLRKYDIPINITLLSVNLRNPKSMADKAWKIAPRMHKVLGPKRPPHFPHNGENRKAAK